MATLTQTEAAPSTTSRSPPSSPIRKRFSYISPARAVVAIIAPKRHSSHSDFSSISLQQRRTVSTPTRLDDSGSGTEQAVELEMERKSSSASAATSASDTNTDTTTRSLSFPHVANIFVKLRRVQKKVKAHHIDSTSGAEPVTHASLDADADSLKKRARLDVQNVFMCADAVDVPKLLRASRASLLDRASLFQANTLVEEQWSCSICGPKHRSDGSFRVHIRYTATAARSSQRDPGQPIALETVRGVPGLMTITTRDVVSMNVLELFQES